jgi:hypothetical protein
MNDRLHPLFRAVFDDLRDGNAALARAAAKGPLNPDGSRMPQDFRELRGILKPPRQYIKDIRLTFEQPPIPLRQFDWRAMYDGDDEEPSRHGWGRTPEEALADLKRVDADFEDSLKSEQERLEEEYP